jgi:hypothetical protein
MPIEQAEKFKNVDGEMVGTGLWVPDEKDQSTPTLLSSLTTRYDIQDAKQILENPRRKPARVRFPSKQYIRNQGSRGSCNGYSIAKALERARVARGLPYVALSGESIYAGINGGRDQGSGLKPGMDWLQTRGVAPESMVRHQEYLWRNISKEARDAMSRFRGFECYAAPDEENLFIGITIGFIAVVAVHFGGAMQQLDSHGVAGALRGVGNHSVGVDDVRIRNGRIEFDYFNSHGLRYGQEGKAWLTWDRHFAQPSRYHQFFLIRASTDDPKGDTKIEVA